VSGGLFLSWAPFSRRTETLARRFGLREAFVGSPWPKRPLYAPLKYPAQAARTLALLARERPASLWVMDPPLPAVALAAAVARRRRVPLVVDVHTVDFYDPKWLALKPLERPLLRGADAVVVTNRSLARRVLGWGCEAFVLPDPLPEPPALGEVTVVPRSATVVATFSDDEPLHLLPAVARMLPDVEIRVTGEPRGRDAGWPANLRATGFLDDEVYWRTLAASAAVVVLTTRPDTLLSGGYEALALRRPLVVSDQAVLREYFGDAAVYAGVTAAAIAAAIGEALARGDELRPRLDALAARREAEWSEAAAALARVADGRR
jgi:glycosyltransferase involved in cell wall biosynthesis